MVRISRKLSLININHKMNELQNYFSNNSMIIAAFLYGSYGTETQTRLSDVDLAILLNVNKISFDDELKISSDIRSLTGEDDINIMILNDIPLPLQYSILSTGNRIYEKDINTLNDFIEYVTKMYLDFAIHLHHFYCRKVTPGHAKEL
ncbi:MAG: type VII toxin-antitoxin system MntA family adenylyltransferase antitoxin [Bacillota bacterium]